MKKLLVILFGLFFISISWAEEDYLLQLKYKKGDKITSSSKGKNTMENKIEIEIPNAPQQMPTQEMSTETQTDCKYTDEILELDEKGKIKKLKKEIMTFKNDIKMEPQPPVNMPEEELEGEILIVTKDGDDIEVKREGSTFKSPAYGQFASTIDEEIGIYLSDKPVKVKEKWTVDSKKFARIIKNQILNMEDQTAKIKNISGNVECELNSVTEEKGEKIAKVSCMYDLEITVEIKSEVNEEEMGGTAISGETTMSIKAKSEICLNIGKGTAVSSNTTAKFKMNMESETSVQGMDMTMKISGSGEIEDEITFSNEPSN